MGLPPSRSNIRLVAEYGGDGLMSQLPHMDHGRDPEDYRLGHGSHISPRCHPGFWPWEWREV